MDPETLLENMAPLREPPPVALWPPAMGWWLVAIATLAALIYGLYRWRQHWRTHAYRRQALAQLSALRATDHATAADVSRLLKAVSLRVWPAQEVAELHGLRWVQFLNAQVKQLPDQADLAQLATVYERPDAKASAELLLAAEHWIKRHRRAHD